MLPLPNAFYIVLQQLQFQLLSTIYHEAPIENHRGGALIRREVEIMIRKIDGQAFYRVRSLTKMVSIPIRE